ncbi:MAG: hypothetical protein P4L99_05340 [Chthoniobacter sp.]|nr:hypothetical protein [Chthoniobacter sp.]
MESLRDSSSLYHLAPADAEWRFSPALEGFNFTPSPAGLLLFLFVEAAGFALFAFALVVAAGVAFAGCFATGVAFLAAFVVFGIRGCRDGKAAHGKGCEENGEYLHNEEVRPSFPAWMLALPIPLGGWMK